MTALHSGHPEWDEIAKQEPAQEFDPEDVCKDCGDSDCTAMFTDGICEINRQDLGGEGGGE